MIIKPNELHLWYANDELIEQSPEALEHCKKIINAEEAAKTDAFHFKHDQQLYLLSHGMLRMILSYYDPSVAPQQWEFNKSKYGKWSIANPNSQSLTFNLSHTRAGIVVLVARDIEVGVDIESTRTSRLSGENSPLSIASNFFNVDEVNDLQTQTGEQQKTYFLRLWTLKESYIKAIGKGLSADLTSFSFRFPMPEKLSFTSHSFLETKSCLSWHYESNQGSLVSISALNLKQNESSPDVRIHDFSKVNNWGESKECYQFFAKS